MAIAPLVVVLAGPNGAGKSTSAAHLLRGALAVDEFVNADTIAQGLSAYRPESAAVTAGRVMLERLRFLARERRDFGFETTLAGRGQRGGCTTFAPPVIAPTRSSSLYPRRSLPWRASPSVCGKAGTMCRRPSCAAVSSPDCGTSSRCIERLSMAGTCTTTAP